VNDASRTSWNGAPQVSWSFDIPAMPDTSHMTNEERKKYGLSNISKNDATVPPDESMMLLQKINEDAQKGGT
jgi:hypothetical protein